MTAPPRGRFADSEKGKAMASITVTRRQFTLGSIAAALGGPAILSLVTEPVAAQDATPGASSAFADLGLPTLDISVTANSFEGLPSELQAGRYLVTATFAEGLQGGSGAIGFLRPPDGHSTDELLQIIGGLAQAESSPAAMDMTGTPPAGGEEAGGAPPPIVYQSTFAGGTGGPSGMSAQVVLDLGPGDWILWGDDPSAPQKPITFTVTGDMPADLAAPQADITVTLVDFAITFDGSLTAGDHVMEVTNEGAEPHFVVLFSAPDGLTNDQFAEVLGLEEGATPPADLPYKESDFMPLLQTGTESIGTSLWTSVSLKAGTYAAACFFPTAGTGEPHAMKGMHTVFTVAG
jgi:hypothetical protein